MGLNFQEFTKNKDFFASVSMHGTKISMPLCPWNFFSPLFQRE
jgi:hypothetical protein